MTDCRVRPSVVLVAQEQWRPDGALGDVPPVSAKVPFAQAGLEERDIWHCSGALNQFRDCDWMQETCRSCDENEKVFGRRRCQAYLLAGEAAAADPVCFKSPHQKKVVSIVRNASAVPTRPIVFRIDSEARAMPCFLLLWLRVP